MLFFGHSNTNRPETPIVTIILCDRYLQNFERESLRRQVSRSIDEARANGDRRIGYNIVQVVAR